jgi:cytochrome P450
VAKTALHEKYGPVVRISPNELSFTTGQAWKTLYGHRKGAAQKSIAKDPRFYLKSVNGYFHLLGTPSDEDHARQRKILSHSFSDRSLKEQEPLFKEWAHLLVRKLGEAGSAKPVDMVS